MRKRLFAGLILVLVSAITVQGQEQKSLLNADRLDVNAAFETAHLWRGLIISDEPTLSATITYGLTRDKALSLGIWGASALSNDKDHTHYTEIDYFVQYSKNRLYLSIWDLFNMRGINPMMASSDIGNYSKSRTTHILEFRGNYTFGPAFPLYLEFDSMLYGGANAGEVMLDPSGKYDKNKYSSYVQVGYPFIRSKKVDLDAFVGGGFAFNDSKNSLYGDGKRDFSFSNIGLTAKHNFQISDNYGIPVTLMTMWNPSGKYARVYLAATLFSF